MGTPGSWARAASPGELGWSAEGLRAARSYAATIDTDAVSIVVAGRIVDEWGDVATRFNVHSIRKAFVSALIGIHVHEGRLRLSDTLADLGIDDNEPALTAAEKQATVADLLKARSRRARAHTPTSDRKAATATCGTSRRPAARTSPPPGFRGP